MVQIVLQKGKTTGWIGYHFHGLIEDLKILILVNGILINLIEDMIFHSSIP